MEKLYPIGGKGFVDELEAKRYLKEQTKNIENFNPKGRLKISFDYLNLKPEMKVLDVGSHYGIIDYYLAKRHPKVEFYGIDIVPHYVELANECCKLENISYVTGNILANDFQDETFDYVLFFETIEHVDSPMDYAKEFYRIIKPDGHLIISTPNAIGITNILHNLKNQKNVKKIETEKRGTGTEIDHLYNWDKRTLFRLLNRAGFEYEAHATSNIFSLRGGQSIVMSVRKPKNKVELR